jgi:hypothetical protein
MHLATARKDSDATLDLMRSIDALPLPTEDERRRADLITRLACALEEMAETNDPLLDQALGWKNQPDLAQRLDAWERRAGG